MNEKPKNKYWITTKPNPYIPINFWLEVNGIVEGGFSEVSGLESEIEVESYEEGGVNGYVHQFPTRVKYPTLVLSRGLTNEENLWLWYKKTTNGTVDRKNGSIILLNWIHEPVMWWDFINAYPVKWKGPDFNARNGTEVAIERFELVHEGINQKIR
ncbi:MAG: phage tail protein [Oscillatoria sp. SIO1A7]|nr:phage tail protein [Oscillatoria sp. SIO1A7]